MYRSGSVWPVDAENAPVVVRSKMNPFSYSVRKMSRTTRAWFRVVVLVKRSYERPSLRRSSRMTAL
jgi:hypothetical protein